MRRSTRNRPPPKPTWTHLVFEYLRVSDDFVTTAQIKAAVNGNFNQIGAALSHLHKRKAVDFMVAEGVTYWFATPDTDNRSKQVEERVPEEPGSRRTRKTHTIKEN